MASGHSCCGGAGGHEAGCTLDPALDRSTEFSLYTKIKWSEFCCLNESAPGSGKKIFKPWKDRLSDDMVSTDCDGDIIFNIPFDGEVKLLGIIIVGRPDGTHPNKVKLFKGGYIDFEEARGEATQELELTPDPKGVNEYPLKVTRFNGVSYLSLYFPGNIAGGEETVISYIGLRGEFKKVNRSQITIANYEVTPNMSDHKSALDQGTRPIM